MTEEPQYRVTIEPRSSGGYIASLTGPNIPLCDVEITDTVEEARDWAERRVYWHKTKDKPVVYEL